MHLLSYALCGVHIFYKKRSGLIVTSSLRNSKSTLTAGEGNRNPACLFIGIIIKCLSFRVYHSQRETRLRLP